MQMFLQFIWMNYVLEIGKNKRCQMIENNSLGKMAIL